MTKMLAILLFLWVVPLAARADSPLTSTDFSPGFTKSKYVTLARKSGGKISPRLLKFIGSKASLPEKIAVINALGWGEHAMDNARQIEAVLASKAPDAEQYCIRAYALALGNYFDVSEALRLSSTALALGTRSYTAHMVHALIRAQTYMDNTNTWCQVYRVCDDVRMNNTLVKDMPEASIASIFSYIELYKDYC